jgi:predicted nucleic acid-binding protein
MTGPEPRLFVDTNVWLYAFISGQDTNKSHVANVLLKRAPESLVVSTQVINEVCVNMLRKANADEAMIRRLLLSFYRHYEVVSLDEATLLSASELRQRYSLSFWDSLIVAAALRSGAAFLYAEDMQHQLVVDDTLTIINPFLTD